MIALPPQGIVRSQVMLLIIANAITNLEIDGALNVRANIVLRDQSSAANRI